MLELAEETENPLRIDAHNPRVAVLPPTIFATAVAGMMEMEDREEGPEQLCHDVHYNKRVAPQ